MTNLFEKCISSYFNLTAMRFLLVTAEWLLSSKSAFEIIQHHILQYSIFSCMTFIGLE